MMSENPNATATSRENAKKVAILIAPGFEEMEAIAPYDILTRAEVPCDLISIGDGTTVTSSHGLSIVCGAVLSDVDLDGYDMIVLPGGMPGMTNLKANETVRAALARFAESGKRVSAICASPSILAELGLLTGLTATSNPNFQDVLTEHGVNLVQDEVAQDGVFITSKGAGTAVPFALEIARYYRGDDVVAQLRKGLVLDS